ncbi:pyridoxamine 5'-phosphate oxidase family protein [Sanguibacter sp. 26GB23]|uniref:pyridoxamine 5'-phosphate oxidase family protein n=1 Tax=Sanguibacter sp. 26GB23 TaxID=3156066 RepID=UPI0032AE8828
MTSDVPALRARLRALPVFPETVPTFDVGTAPADPVELFVAWLDEAVDAGQPAPHAPVLSTSGATGDVAARTLALKDVDSHGWWFATHATSPKGRDLAENAAAAMTFFWPVVGRQVRVAGRVERLGPDEVARDFLARRDARRTPEPAPRVC